MEQKGDNVKVVQADADQGSNEGSEQEKEDARVAGSKPLNEIEGQGVKVAVLQKKAHMRGMFIMSSLSFKNIAFIQFYVQNSMNIFLNGDMGVFLLGHACVGSYLI